MSDAKECVEIVTRCVRAAPTNERTYRKYTGAQYRIRAATSEHRLSVAGFLDVKVYLRLRRRGENADRERSGPRTLVYCKSERIPSVEHLHVHCEHHPSRSLEGR